MKASDLFIQALVNEGVQHIFAVPGEENLDLLESIRTSGIQLIVLRHEQAAGFMAATYGRLTGKTGVCLTTLGPGATNLVTAAAHAQLGAMPMLMITGQKPIKQSEQGKFQIIDVVEMMRPLTKMTKQIVNGNTIPNLVREAFRQAETERPGAVHLELPEDIAREECNTTLFEINTVLRPHADQLAIKQACELIESAIRPLILIGAGASRNPISNHLNALLHKTAIPFFDTQMGKGVIDERSELYLGTAALSDGDYLHCAIDRADLIINIGHDTVEKPPFLMRHNGAKVIHMNFSPAEIDDVYFPNLEVIGDLSSTIERLTDMIKPSEFWDFSYYQRVKAEVDQHIGDGSDDPRFPIFPPRLVKDVREVMPVDGILALDNGMYKIWFARNYPAYMPNTVLLDNALATMGAGLSSAMAAKMVHPHRQVVAVCGDGGFMMNSHQLEPAVRLNMHLVILLLRDNGYGMIKWKQATMHFPNYGLDFNNPDFVKYAESYGAHGHRVTKTAELKTILSYCLETHGVHLIEVPVDYSENAEFLGSQLQRIRSQFLESFF